ncbi:MAG: lysostaphin resistance A-like protein [Anaerolineales bacterium]
MINRKAISAYLIIAFGIAWILFCLPLVIGKSSSTNGFSSTLIFWSIAMWAPGVAALLTTLVVRKQPLGVLNLNRLGERKLYLYAWLIPLLLAIATAILTWAFGLGKLDIQFSQIKEAMQNAPGGTTIPVWLVVLLQIIFSITLAPLINTIFAIGEELGWRGFLLPQLLPLGQGKAILLSGAIWGIWHAPAIIQGHNYPNHPYLGVFLMIIFCILMGTLLSWLYLRTQSPWAPALAHGTLNAVAGLPLMFLQGVDITLGGTIASLRGWIPLGLLVGWFYWRKLLPLKLEPDATINVSRETI